MRRFFTLAVLLLAALHIMAQTDFNTAQAIAAGETKTGTVSAGNRTVYFKTLLPADGTVNVYLEGEHKAGNAGSVDFYAYDKSKNQILVKYTLGGKNISLGEKFKDTVQIFSRAADSIYLLVYQNSSQTFDFKLSYEVKDQSVNDTEPNDEFSQSLLLKEKQHVNGHIGYVKNNQTDRSDFYKTLLPKSGTVTIYVEGLHTGGRAGSLDLYAYDKSKRQIQVKYTLGGKNISLGEKFKDTIRIYSRSVDSLYIQLYQGRSQSFSYSLQYEVTNQNIDDAEPNDDFSHASAIIHEETKYGRIGHIANGVTDRNDYYKTILPATGTVTLYIQGTHTGGNAGSFDLYVYDKSQRQVQVKYTLGGKNITMGQQFSDTIQVFSRSADTLYFLLYQGSRQSFDYSIRYEITRQNPDDKEPNNTFTEALPIATNDSVFGRIGYVANNITDRNDYYMAVPEADGTVTVYIRGTHTGGRAGSLDFYVYDKSKRQIFVKYTLGGKNISLGEQFFDTIRVYSRAADTLYFSPYQSSSQSFDYAMSYEVLDQSTNDQEPNNAFAQALPLPYQEVVEGHIGYVANNVTDRNDYYMAVPEADGTVTVYIRGTHTGGRAGSLDFYVYDKSKRQIFVKYILGGKNISLGEQFFDTIRVYSRAADTLYFSPYQSSSQSFAYTLSYDVLDQSPDDQEPNNDFSQALHLPYQEVVEGHIGYVANNVTDRNDYYMAVPEADGTVTVYIRGTHTGGRAGSLDFYVYDKSKRQIFVKYILGGKNISLGEQFFDTIRVYSRAADTLYFSPYQGSSQSFAYTLSYDVLDQSPDDPEPNDNFAKAKPILHSETIEGHIGYIANNVTDRSDYFKTLLPVDGTVTVFIEATHTGGRDGSFTFYAYDKSQRQILVKYTLGNRNIKYGQTLLDTITIASRAADSLYFLLYQGSSQSFSYKLRYTMPDALEGDPEPNNTFDESVIFNTGDTLKGLLGYVSNNATDRNDYYKTGVPEKSKITIYVEGTHTGGTAGGFSFYAYDKNRRQIGYKPAIGGNNVTAGQIVKDTITIDCNSTDSLYILLYQGSNRSFAYELRCNVTGDNRPVAAYSFTRTGNEFGFINESKNTDKLLWNIANQTSTNPYPLHEFSPGFYEVRLIATNTTCNFTDTVKKEITVTGIESFTPTEAGIGGDMIVTLFGGGLTQNTHVSLVNGGKEINTIKKLTSENGNQLGVVFDLHFGTPGVYDLKIQFPDEDPIVYSKAITISEMEYPETWSEVTGPSIWRTGRTSNFNLVVGNRGNTIARGVIVALAWSKSIDIEWIGKEHRPSPDEFTEVVMDDGEVIRKKNDIFQWLYDINTVVPIDTFGFEPFDGFVRYFFVPAIASGSTYELPFRATSNSSDIHQFRTFTIKPNRFGSCETFNIGSTLTSPQGVELYINTLDIIVDEIKVPPMTKIPAQVAVKSLKVSQKHIDVSSNILFHRMWAKWYGADDLTESEYYDYYKEGLQADEFAINEMKNIAFDQTINLGVGGLANKRANKLTDQLHASQQEALNHKRRSEALLNRAQKGSRKSRNANLMASREEARIWKEAFQKGEHTLDEIKSMDFLLQKLQDAKDTKTLHDEAQLLLKYIKENCPEQKEQIKELEEMLGKEEDIIDPREKNVETRTSYDPNAIYGPSGFTPARYVNAVDQQNFMITFENVDTAKADAQIVKIYDTLDKRRFDLSTFEFGSIIVGSAYYKVPKGRKQFLLERNLDTRENMKLRINGSIDTLTGIVFWQFTSIDSRTGDLPDFDGFLPPNIDYPSGEGSVTYSVRPISGLANESELLSRASIIFDTNEPILTNTWVNTIDVEKPKSKITAKVTEDSLILLEYSATDAGSGVGYFNLYASEDNGDWVPISGGNVGSQLMEGKAGKSYRFYVEVQDKTGNRETKNAVSETTVMMATNSGGATNESEMLLYPVPSNGTIDIELNVTETQQLIISVYSATGQRVAELYNGSAGAGNLKISKALHHLSSGLYFVHARGSKGINQKKKLVFIK